jgi:predicted RNase H-like nuclease
MAPLREVLVGFDSAWADNPRNPGAVAACVLDAGRCVAFHPPRLARFAEAARFVAEVGCGADAVLVAIDQPTVVANETGSRPIDRVAASLVSRLRGGVQPARRGGTGAAMFGDGAPIWRFLDAIGAAQDPLAARGAASGRFVMEVFPALALPEIVPAIWARRRSAEYNPAARLFLASDWPLVASGVAAFARGLGAEALAEWADAAAGLDRPRKADQDRLDAAICVAIALAWRHGPATATLQLGDARSGLMATIASGEVRAVLVAAAERLGVAVDGVPAVAQP